MDLVTVKEAAEILNVTVGRVHQLINENRLPAEKLGSQYVVKKSDLELVNDRKPGRPKKAKEDETLTENPASGLEREN